MIKLYRKNKEMYKIFKGITLELGRPLLHLVFDRTKPLHFWVRRSWIWCLIKLNKKSLCLLLKNSTMSLNPRNCPCRSCKKLCQHWIYLNYDFLGLTNFNKKFILYYANNAGIKKKERLRFNFF